MATPVTTEPAHEEHEERRRRRALALVADIRRSLDRVCPQIQRADRDADVISEIIGKTRELASLTGAKDLLPTGVRRDLADAADRFERWRTRVGDAADLCERLYKTLDEAERILSARAIADERTGRRSLSKVVGTGLAVVAVVVAAVVLAILLLDDDNGGDNGGGLETGKPDLTISSLDAASPVRRDGKEAAMAVVVVVHNAGNADAGPFTLTPLQSFPGAGPKPALFRVEGNANQQTPIVPGLKAGGSVTLRGDISGPDTPGPFPGATITVAADWCGFGEEPACHVAESNEGNNESKPVEMPPTSRR